MVYFMGRKKIRHTVYTIYTGTWMMYTARLVEDRMIHFSSTAIDFCDTI